MPQGPRNDASPRAWRVRRELEGVTSLGLGKGALGGRARCPGDSFRNDPGAAVPRAVPGSPRLTTSTFEVKPWRDPAGLAGPDAWGDGLSALSRRGGRTGFSPPFPGPPPPDDLTPGVGEERGPGPGRDPAAASLERQLEANGPPTP